MLGFALIEVGKNNTKPHVLGHWTKKDDGKVFLMPTFDSQETAQFYGRQHFPEINPVAIASSTAIQFRISPHSTDICVKDSICA